jgi:hypothetical protein
VVLGADETGVLFPTIPVKTDAVVERNVISSIGFTASVTSCLLILFFNRSKHTRGRLRSQLELQCGTN